ncbi:MAG: hypothetical protein ACT6XS_16975 [Phreatobacter sp.]|uniref:hypothetical protein n=1 Tax=Phreatobacter sp. TaxID=1966341 RepID=UPI004036EC01
MQSQKMTQNQCVAGIALRPPVETCEFFPIILKEGNMLTADQIAEERRAAIAECFRQEARRLINAGNDPAEIMDELIFLGLSGALVVHGVSYATNLHGMLEAATERLHQRLAADQAGSTSH